MKLIGDMTIDEFASAGVYFKADCKALGGLAYFASDMEAAARCAEEAPIYLPDEMKVLWDHDETDCRFAHDMKRKTGDKLTEEFFL